MILFIRDILSRSKLFIKTVVFWVVAPRGLVATLMLDAANTTETSVEFNQSTRCNNPEERHLHTPEISQNHLDVKFC